MQEVSKPKKYTQSKNCQKVITRHIWQDYLDISEEYRYKNSGKKEYSQRKETIERIFGSAKEFHGFRYTNMRDLLKMEMKAALTFACMNIKKLALMCYRLDPNKSLREDNSQKYSHLKLKIIYLHMKNCK